jgi:hypothetical protein
MPAMQTGILMALEDIIIMAIPTRTETTLFMFAMDTKTSTIPMTMLATTTTGRFREMFPAGNFWPWA